MPGMDGRHYIGDGIDLGGLIAPNVETNETDYPHITEFNEFTTDSCGAGWGDPLERDPEMVMSAR